MNRSFGLTEFQYLLTGAQWTIMLSLIAFTCGGLLGLVIAFARISRFKAVRLAATAYVQMVQGTPLLIQLFIAYFGLTLLGATLPALFAAGLALTIYASAFLGEIWRGCLESVPRAQWVGADSLGLTRTQQLYYVIVPQAARIATPPTVGFMVQIVKNTSLTALVGFIELARAGQLLNNITFQPAVVFLCVGALYFAICFPLSALSQKLEVKLNAGRSSLQHS
ncbi:MAG: amino acid transporter permease [Ramlibacter sp.]|nr:amino acid transporter permease [Ramlibacter sp.]